MPCCVIFAGDVINVHAVIWIIGSGAQAGCPIDRRTSPAAGLAPDAAVPLAAE